MQYTGKMSAIEKMNAFLDWYYRTVKSTKVISNEVFIDILQKFENSTNKSNIKVLPTGVTCLCANDRIEVIMPSLENRSENYKRIMRECEKGNLFS